MSYVRLSPNRGVWAGVEYPFMKNEKTLIKKLQTIISQQPRRVISSYFAPFQLDTSSTIFKKFGEKFPLDIFFPLKKQKKRSACDFTVVDLVDYDRCVRLCR